MAVDQTTVVIAVPVSVALATITAIGVWLKRRNGRNGK